MVRKIGTPKKKVSGTAVVGKKRTPARKSRKRRVSGATDIGGMLKAGAGVVLGAIVAREINNLANTVAPGISPKVTGAIEFIGGLMVPEFIKNDFAKNVGLGLAALGGQQVLLSFGLITGAPDTITYYVNGLPQANNLTAINGPTAGNRLNAVNGPEANRLAAGVIYPKKVTQHTF